MRQAGSLPPCRPGATKPHTRRFNYIIIMTNAVKKYKTVPKHQEMISDSMFHHIACLYIGASADSFVHDVIDWIILGCYTGFCKSEWCSDHHKTFNTIDDPNWGNCPMALPIIADDFGFSTEKGQHIHDLASTLDNTIAVTSLCIQKQKKNDNGQTLTYQHCTNSSWMCPMQTSLNIARQPNHLRTPCNHPAAVYHPTTGLCCKITASQVAAILLHFAHKVFNIPEGHKNLLAWYRHSI